jgi:hypothetical protein
MMKRLMFMTVGAAVLALGTTPLMAEAQLADAIQLTNDAIVELSDPPGLGKRTTVDPLKRWGADVGVTKSATAKLQDALSKAQSAGAGKSALHQLEMATDFGKTGMHKEARLKAQGALFHLCHGAESRGLRRTLVRRAASPVA